MITGRSIASPVIPHLKNPPNGHQTATIPVSPQWTFGGICCGSAEASTLCPACPGLCVALASLAPLKNFSSTKVSLGVFRFFREPPVNLSGFFFFFIGCTAVNIVALKSRPLYVFHKASLSVPADTPTHNLSCCYCATCVFFECWKEQNQLPFLWIICLFLLLILLPLIEISVMGPALQNSKGWWVTLIT